MINKFKGVLELFGEEKSKNEIIYLVIPNNIKYENFYLCNSDSSDQTVTKFDLTDQSRCKMCKPFDDNDFYSINTTF